MSSNSSQTCLEVGVTSTSSSSGSSVPVSSWVLALSSGVVVWGFLRLQREKTDRLLGAGLSGVAAVSALLGLEGGERREEANALD
jgi:hypothetical protein